MRSRRRLNAAEEKVVKKLVATTNVLAKHLGGTAGDSGATTFAGFLQELRHLYNLCSKGGGGAKGSPDF